MTNPLCFEDLRAMLHQQVEPWPDCRTGRNTPYRMPDAALGACGIFFTPSPSFFESQRRLQATKGGKNAPALVGVTKMPCANHLRTLLDPIAPSPCAPVFVDVCARLAPHHLLDRFRVLGDQLLVALDGTTYFASQAIQGATCLPRRLAHGPTLSSHPAITPVVGCPGRSQVIALPPASIMPQDGHDKQDGEQVASKRWIRKHAEAFAPYQGTLLGDDLDSNHLFCALALAQGCTFILVCKPDAPPKLYDRIAFWHTHDGISACASRPWHGHGTAVSLDRFLHDVLLLDGPEAVSVNGFDLTGVNATTGAQLSPKSFLTNHRVTAAHVAAVAQAGRGRWKIANEHNHVLKTTGSHVEHNFGPGQQYLAAVLRRLNLLAFWFHTVLEWRDDQ